VGVAVGDGLARTRAVEAIRDGLRSGRWAPGTVLQDKEIAAELHLSKTPVREALLTLTATGHLVALQRLGYAVPGISLADLAELFAFRTLIECEVVGVLATRGAAVTLASPPDGHASWQSEHAFHQALAAQAGGTRMPRVLAEHLDTTSGAMAHLGVPADIADAVAQEHLAINQAIRARDLMLSRALMTVHLTRLRETLMAGLRQRFRDKNLLA
jgi:DNA-binding GntR family transcriptional regulator